MVYATLDLIMTFEAYCGYVRGKKFEECFVITTPAEVFLDHVREMVRKKLDPGVMYDISITVRVALAPAIASRLYRAETSFNMQKGITKLWVGERVTSQGHKVINTGINLMLNSAGKVTCSLYPDMFTHIKPL